MKKPPPLLAIVGCGAISEEYYIPAIKQLPDWAANTWLVDPSPQRLSQIVRQYGFEAGQAVGSIAELPSSIAGAINATPSHLHLPTSLELIDRGASVFLEKPFAECAEDARAIVAAAERKKAKISCNQFRRRFPAYQMVRQFIQSGKLGRIRKVQWAEGGKFDWPTQSGFYFRRPWPNNMPRGCLLDTGAHIVDVICWWLDGVPTATQVHSDNHGGPEAHISADLRLGDTEIGVEITFLAKLDNVYSIEGELGSIRGACYDTKRFFFTPKGGKERAVLVGGSGDRMEIAHELVVNFCDSISGGADLMIDATSVLPSIEVIDNIYAAASSTLPSYYKAWAK